MTAPFTRIAVTVTFLRLEDPASAPKAELPPGSVLVRLPRPTVPFYRYLYDTVGARYVWWLRRTASDAEIARMLAHPAHAVCVLYRDCEPAGFFELEDRGSSINLSYFGLLPHAIGQGLGQPLLLACLAETARARPGVPMTVNTCTADHPRALSNYLRAGFQPVRTVREVWDVPTRLGLDIPEHLRL